MERFFQQITIFFENLAGEFDIENILLIIKATNLNL